MSDAPLNAANGVQFDEHKGFLPYVPMPTPLPPEPVAIADMANMFGVTHRTLHFYEEKAIITSRRSGLMRIYCHRDVHRMAVINTLREIGVPVATIQDVMAKLETAPSQTQADAIFQDALETRKRELATEISTVHRQIQQINELTISDADGEPEHKASRPKVDLTPGERKCLELMAEGYAPVRLSRTLGLSAEDVQNLEAGIIAKFGANNRFQAVAKAVLAGVITA
ncbi:MerR family transcriptional regulator [Agrobacterium larrymoorei]|uniref:MerR family transcriptional regulator n=1 Tax=Agrobacterium larrymoorei TaxID=160699 RepID=UPI00307F48F2